MAVKELHSAPRLSALYPKALLGGLRTGGREAGGALPATEYVRGDVVVDPAQLAAYNQVCGFRLTDELPATYQHILAFPLQMALMTEKDFPFPVLGMVHVANRITQTRPVRLDEPFTLRVRAENLRPHEKGTQFDVVSELVPNASAEHHDPIWTDVSTYLRRGGGSGGDRSKGAREQLAPPAPSAIWRVPGDIGRRYAEVSGDRNPIHLHPLTARLFGFRSAIAHGMWTKARCLAAFEGRLPEAFTIDVRFKLPVFLPAKVAFTSWRTEEGWAAELWDARRPKPHLDATITAG
ncbi:MaoC like domain-containing protein [Amycolatopsis arida]|uniref:MaoC like domain-containing protein n=1 Tax=Amycolatopsis arida TaxID=587909 RepID=A0A1I5TE76_9PSEU|nr:MaoC/PaaZ C-terminal domain-containing protein [Amycolatopsis arida]TDX96127.1 MaoC dehydratase-like protein [Amycolatopsis arida]SFP81353.1 MaoC like domain-containing protein [Amycolatopsis arida]